MYLVGNKTPSNKNFIEKGIYAVTINPDDKHQYFGKADRLQLFRTTCHNGLLFLRSIHVDYHLYIELSEPKNNSQGSKNGPRLHLHGILKFRSTLSIKNFLLHGIYNLTRWSNYDLDTIKDLDIWKAYCQKQQHIMKETPISNTDTTLWDSKRSAEGVE